MSKSSNGITRGFILRSGEIAKNGTRHDDIALEYLSSHKELWEKYLKKPQGYSLCDFMVLDLGSIKVGNNIGRPDVITFKLTRDMPKEFWAYIDFYQRKGYRVDKI